ncbi:MAG: sensor histidine kinase [Caulobacteraceae bacterium]|nr:sensor histidine kinase [Caulobacteraceae bacterium]
MALSGSAHRLATRRSEGDKAWRPIRDGDFGAPPFEMTGDWPSQLRRIAAECLFGGVVLAVLIFAGFRLGLGVAATGFICLTALVLLSLRGSLTSSVLLSAAAVAALAYIFSKPIVVDLKAYITRDVALAIAFPLTTLIVTWLVKGVRKRAAALSESEHHWRAIFEQTPTMYFLIDANGTVQSVNGFGAAQLGYAVSELAGQPVMGIFLEADRSLVQDNLTLCAQTPGQSRVWEARKIHKDGAVLWARVNAKFVRWGASEPIFLVSSEDITQRKEAEEAVRRSEAYLQEAQRLGHIGSWAQDLSTGVMTASPEMVRIFGRDPAKDLLNVTLTRESVHPDDQAFTNQVVERGAKSGADFEFEHRIVRPDGTIRHVHSVAHPVFGEGGALVEYTGTVMDVTDHKQSEEALRQAYTDLARVNRITTIGELTASLAHEVNQPIAAAVANANACLRWLAADTPDLEEVRAAAEAIVRNGARAAEIIGRTRRLFEKGAPQREPLEIDDVVRETVLLLGSEASRYAVSIRTFLAAGAPELVADRVQLQQVLMNLILNGIEAMREVEGRREIAIRSQIADDKQIMVSVSDTGVGLPPEQAERLFDTFFTTKPNGTGMGLSISRSIISAHGGKLWAEPNEPRGAVFRFTLPTAAI